MTSQLRPKENFSRQSLLSACFLQFLESMETASFVSFFELAIIFEIEAAGE